MIIVHFMEAETANRDAGLQLAIERAGSIAALARALGINRQAVSSWDQIPLERVPAVESATGVPRQQLRPDFWPQEAAE